MVHDLQKDMKDVIKIDATAPTYMCLISTQLCICSFNFWLFHYMYTTMKELQWHSELCICD